MLFRSGTWKVNIAFGGYNEEQYFANGEPVEITLLPHPLTNAYAFDATDRFEDFFRIEFTPVNVQTGTNILKVQNIGGSHYYQEVPEPVTTLGAVVVLGAIPVLKKKYAKSNKNKDRDT